MIAAILAFIVFVAPSVPSPDMIVAPIGAVAENNCENPGWSDPCWATCASEGKCNTCCHTQAANAMGECWAEGCYDNAVNGYMECTGHCDEAWHVAE
jgi:hypothetical protein